MPLRNWISHGFFHDRALCDDSVGSLAKGRTKEEIYMPATRPGSASLQIVILSIAFLTASLFAACCLPQENPFLHGPELTEFIQRGPTEVYNRDTLFDYMNGEAEAYLPLGFSLLYTERYRKPGTDIVILVEVYDMGSPTGAQGIFDVYTRKGGTEVGGIGNEAWTDKAVILFRQNRYFFRVGPDPTEPTDVFPTLNDLKLFSRSMDHVVSLVRHP